MKLRDKMNVDPNAGATDIPVVALACNDFRERGNLYAEVILRLKTSFWLKCTKMALNFLASNELNSLYLTFLTPDGAYATGSLLGFFNIFVIYYRGEAAGGRLQR